MSRGPFFIAEAGVNHNGDIDHALAMVDAAAKAGADCVKFQAFDPDKLIARGTRAAAYQTRNTGHSDQLDMIRSLALSRQAFEKVAARCKEKDIEFLATAFDSDFADFLVGLGMRRSKIASGELTNRPALIAFAKLGLPVVLSTGMATDVEVDWAVGVLRQAGAREITILQCTTIYPAPVAHANLKAMVAMGERHGLPFGYSDHTLGDHVAIAATVLGASIIEKHFTLDRNLPGPDHKASLEPDELALMVRRVAETALALGSRRKLPSPEELATAALVRRSWHAARDLAADTVLEEHDAVLLRPASGIPATEWIGGRRLTRSVGAGQPLLVSDLGPA